MQEIQLVAQEAQVTPTSVFGNSILIAAILFSIIFIMFIFGAHKPDKGGLIILVYTGIVLCIGPVAIVLLANKVGQNENVTSPGFISAVLTIVSTLTLTAIVSTVISKIRQSRLNRTSK